MPTDDYIKRSDALKAILGVSIYDTIEELEGARTIAENTWADGLWDAYKIIEEEVDAADVEPKRKTGRWIEQDSWGDTYYTCSVCGGDFVTLDGESPEENEMQFCPMCGAKMEGEADDGNRL